MTDLQIAAPKRLIPGPLLHALPGKGMAEDELCCTLLSLAMSKQCSGENMQLLKGMRLHGRRCFEDRCPHRLAPLSEGRIEPTDGSLFCNYHGDFSAWRSHRPADVQSVLPAQLQQSL